MITGFGLATLNALFNTTAAICMFLGWRAIKRGERERHKRLMLGAFAASCAFLTSYITRMAMFGDTRFGGEGVARIAYLVLLGSHVVLALAAAPLVITTLTLGLRERFDTHRRFARVTFPIWAYVSVTGVIVYVVLYHFARLPEPPPVGTAAARETDRWIEAIQSRGAHGDWIVVRGTHPGDQVVAAATGARYTHAAVLDKERGEVIEAVGRGVTVSPVRELLAQAIRMQVVRPRGFSPELGRAAVARARSRVGAGYDWLGTIGVQADRRFYCTELCADAYGARSSGLVPDGVLHPEHMQRYGEVVYDSGARQAAPVPDPSAELRARFAKLLPAARGVDYAAIVAPGLMRGGMPDDEGVRWLREQGIRTVINLRHYHGDSEGELVRAAGMRYERIPLESTDPPEPEQVQRFLAIVRDPAARPVYVHCLHGVDRTGAMISTYRIAEQGWSNADALAEMEHFGAHDVLHDLRRFVGTFRP